MSFKCQICNSTPPPRTSMRKYCQHRADGQIAREWACCQTCHEKLNAGYRLDVLVGLHRQQLAQQSQQQEVA